MVIEQATGMASVTGPPDLPMHPGGLVDPVNGMHAAVAIQAALEHRDRTGEGQLIEIGQLETGANLTAELVIQWSARGEALGRIGNRDHRFAPQGVYRCRDDSGMPTWVALTVETDGQWQALADAIGRHDWVDDAALQELSGRQRRHDELDRGVAEWARGLDPDAVVASLRDVGIPVGRVLEVPRTYDDPQLAARDFFQELEHPLSGTRRYPGWPMRFSFLAAPHRRGAPTLGQHNREILSELGFAPDEIDALERDGVVGSRLTAG
jgi:crotonobetainyl-CoA:carnitine CoA-transferase CaiB-like acyl-CoA transferase